MVVPVVDILVVPVVVMVVVADVVPVVEGDVVGEVDSVEVSQRVMISRTHASRKVATRVLAMF